MTCPSKKTVCLQRIGTAIELRMQKRVDASKLATETVRGELVGFTSAQPGLMMSVG